MMLEESRRSHDCMREKSIHHSLYLLDKVRRYTLNIKGHKYIMSLPSADYFKATLFAFFLATGASEKLLAVEDASSFSSSVDF
jgi:hypothetical protein